MSRQSILVAAVCLLSLGCGSAEQCAVSDLSTPAQTPTFALVASDYASSAIALLDSDGTLITAAWLDSGTARPGIVTALSGDVSLPLSPFASCTLIVIDRFGTDVVSTLDTCATDPVRSQVDVGSTFAANPHDVLRQDGRMWVTRYSVNPRAEPDDLERGNDIAIVEGGRVVSKIDLSVADDIDAGVFARPTRMVRLETASGVVRIAVGLARLSADFMGTGSGAVALVDPATRQVTVHALDGLEHCSELDALDDYATRDTFVVTCSGSAFAEEAVRRTGSGVVALRLESDGHLVETASWRAADHPDHPVPSGPTTPLSAERFVTVAWADTDFGDGVTDTMDRVLLIDVSESARETRVLFESTPFSIGDGVYDAAQDLLLLPDAALGVVRRFSADGSERDPIPTTGCRGLPPREIRRITFP